MSPQAHDRLMIGMGAVIFLLLIILLIAWSIGFRDCRAKGGEYVKVGGGYICAKLERL